MKKSILILASLFLIVVSVSSCKSHGGCAAYQSKAPVIEKSTKPM